MISFRSKGRYYPKSYKKTVSGGWKADITLKVPKPFLADTIQKSPKVGLFSFSV